MEVLRTNAAALDYVPEELKSDPEVVGAARAVMVYDTEAFLKDTVLPTVGYGADILSLTVFILDERYELLTIISGAITLNTFMTTCILPAVAKAKHFDLASSGSTLRIASRLLGGRGARRGPRGAPGRPPARARGREAEST
jgi:hypothetical protein